MIVPDSNLLLYAYNLASPYHRRAKAWWETSLSGSEPVGLTYPVLFAFLRIGTSAHAFPNPFSLDEAKSHISAWLDQTATRTLVPGPTHVLDVIQLLEDAGSSGGNLVSNAQIAATALAHTATVHTADRDFLRFPSLKCHFPLEGT